MKLFVVVAFLATFAESKEETQHFKYCDKNLLVLKKLGSPKEDQAVEHIYRDMCMMCPMHVSKFVQVDNYCKNLRKQTEPIVSLLVRTVLNRFRKVKAHAKALEDKVKAAGAPESNEALEESKKEEHVAAGASEESFDKTKDDSKSDVRFGVLTPVFLPLLSFYRLLENL